MQIPQLIFKKFRKNLHAILMTIFSKIGKRRRFVFSALFLTVLVAFSSFFSLDQAEFFLVLLVFFVYLSTFFSILEGIHRIEWLMLFLLPVYFTVAFYLFYFFFPIRWLTRLPYISFYGVSIYALFLSSNIFNVGVTKNLQLYRAAFSVNFLYLTITSFLSFNLILSLRQFPFANMLMFFVCTYPLALQFLWTINPKTTLEPHLSKIALIISLVIAESALVLSFIPLQTAIFGLFTTALFYSLCGLFQAYLEERLFKERVREYIIVVIFVSIITLLTIRWG